MAVKLALDTEGARAAGLDTHVCELQLVLLPMARLLVIRRQAGHAPGHTDTDSPVNGGTPPPPASDILLPAPGVAPPDRLYTQVHRHGLLVQIHRHGMPARVSRLVAFVSLLTIRRPTGFARRFS